MAKPEWGVKRTCYNCGARFYDLRRDHIVCPICSAVYDPDRQPRIRRGGAGVKDDAVVPSRVAAGGLIERDLDEDLGEEEMAEADLDEETEIVEAEEADEGDLGDLDPAGGELIEDTSDLGEDDDDIGEVMEHLDEDIDEKP